MQAFTALGCRDVARVDIRMDGDGRPQLLEINTLPGMYHDPLSTSYFPVAARAAGWDYTRMVGEVLERTITRIDGRLSDGIPHRRPPRDRGAGGPRRHLVRRRVAPRAGRESNPQPSDP